MIDHEKINTQIYPTFPYPEIGHGPGFGLWDNIQQLGWPMYDPCMAEPPVKYVPTPPTSHLFQKIAPEVARLDAGHLYVETGF